MSDRDPKPPQISAESEPLFSAELRATLRRELGPDSGHRARVRDALSSSVAAGTLTPAAQRVEALMHGHAAGVAGGKAGAAAVLHSVGAKLVVLGVVVASGATAVVMLGPTEQSRTTPEAPAAMSRNELSPPPAAPSLAAAPAEPDLTIESALSLQPEAAAGRPSTRAAASSAPQIAAGKRSRAAPVSGHAPALGEPEPAPSSPAQSDPQSAAEGVTQARTPAQPSAAAQISATVSPATTTPTQQAASSQLAVSKHQLAAELTLIRAASDALQRGDAGATLATLQRHGTQFPRGALRVEADALRAIALCTAQSETAAAASENFLKAHTGSALAERVRRACQKR